MKIFENYKVFNAKKLIYKKKISVKQFKIIFKVGLIIKIITKNKKII